MKKLLILVALGLLLVGCSKDAVAKLSNGNEALFTINGESLTNDQLYSLLKAQDSSYFVVENVNKFIVDQEIETTEEMKEQANQTMNLFKQLYGDNFNAVLAQYGFSSEEDYYENSLLLQNRLNALYSKYVNENITEYADSYKAKLVQIMAFDAEDKANAALEALNANEDFETVATNNSSSEVAKEKMVTSKSTLADVVKIWLDTQTEPCTSEVLVDEDNNKYYIVKINNTDYTTFQDQLVTEIIADEAIQTKALASYYKKYNFHIYDIDLLNQFKANKPEYIVQ